MARGALARVVFLSPASRAPAQGQPQSEPLPGALSSAEDAPGAPREVRGKVRSWAGARVRAGAGPSWVAERPVR